jgi:transketolase N-terminal domain/subunit
MIFPAILGNRKFLSERNSIKASNKHASAAVGGNNTTYERLISMNHVMKPNKKAHNSLVYSKGVALTNVHATLQKLRLLQGRRMSKLT